MAQTPQFLLNLGNSVCRQHPFFLKTFCVGLRGFSLYANQRA